MDPVRADATDMEPVRPPTNHERHLMRQAQRARANKKTICNECGIPTSGELFCGPNCTGVWFAKHRSPAEIRGLTLKYAT